MKYGDQNVHFFDVTPYNIYNFYTFCIFMFILAY